MSITLNEWVCITVPGRYRVTAKSRNISSQCSPEHELADDRLAVQSNEIIITLLPADSDWVGSELQRIKDTLGFSSDDVAKRSAIRRLSYLDTPESTKEMAVRLLSGSTSSDESRLSRGLLESSWRETAISELYRGLHVQKQVPQSIYRVLAMLLVAREFQNQPSPRDQIQDDKRQSAIQVRDDRLNLILNELYSIRPSEKLLP